MRICPANSAAAGWLSFVSSASLVGAVAEVAFFVVSVEAANAAVVVAALVVAAAAAVLAHAAAVPGVGSALGASALAW